LARRIVPATTSFRKLRVQFRLYGGVVWHVLGAIMRLLVWSRQGGSGVVAAITAAAAGVLFGLAMAAYYRYGARKHELPLWSGLKAEP
jgi:Family of unknown function (DUF6404)